MTAVACAKFPKTRRPFLNKLQKPGCPFEVSRVKNTCYTARKNFTRNRAEMA